MVHPCSLRNSSPILWSETAGRTCVPPERAAENLPKSAFWEHAEQCVAGVLAGRPEPSWFVPGLPRQVRWQGRGMDWKRGEEKQDREGQNRGGKTAGGDGSAGDGLHWIWSPLAAASPPPFSPWTCGSETAKQEAYMGAGDLNHLSLLKPLDLSHPPTPTLLDIAHLLYS